MPRSMLSILGAGILSAGLFLLASTHALQSSLFFIYTPLIPLFLVGFNKNSLHVLKAGLLALLLIFVISQIELALFYLGFTLIPAWMFTRFFLSRSRHDPAAWYPLTGILLWLSLYASIVFLFVTFHYSGEPGGLPGLTLSQIEENKAQFDPQYADILEKLATDWNFLLFTSAGWAWVMLTFGMAAFSYFILSGKHLSVRGEFHITPHPLPRWALLLLVALSILSFMDSSGLAFAAKVLLLLLLLPYVASGIGLMHEASHRWKARGLWLAMAYLLIISMIWPLLLFGFAGVIDQVRRWPRQEKN